ncbi:MAG: Ig-like domain-containing protein [Deltaproteobacteria bacterium]|nr:Ig-like domain-containing protein [Deltaproteobacteria bacterium]
MGLSADAGDVVLSVVDHLSPAVNILSPANGSRFEPETPISLTVTASDSSGIGNIDLSVTGATADHTQWFNTPGGSPVSHTFTLVIPAGAAPTSPVNVTVTVSDGAGNTGTKNLVIWPADHVIPSAATVACLGGNNVEPGRQRLLRVISDDNVGIAKIKVNVGDFFSQVRDVTPSSHSIQDFYFTVPAGTPLGTSIPVTATVWDSSENALSAAPVSLIAADLTAPSVSITSPANNSEVIPGTDVTISVNSADNYSVARLTCHAWGSATWNQEMAIDPVVATASRQFTLSVPSTAAGGSYISINAFAYDSAGNRGEASVISLKVKDIVPPYVVNMVPPDGATMIEPETALMVSFNEAVLQASINESTLILANADGRAITGVFSMPDVNSAVFTPNISLALGKEYTFTVNTGVCDIVGNHMITSIASTFTIRPRITPLDTDDDGDGFTELDGDCDDNDPDRYPGHAEFPGDNKDKNCNGVILAPGTACNITNTEFRIAPPLLQNSNAGSGVAVSEKYLAVGARGYQYGGLSTGTTVGALLIYERSGTSWTQTPLYFQGHANTGSDTHNLGAPVALSRDRVIIGDTTDDVNGVANCGSASVYVRTQAGWELEGVLYSDAPRTNSGFGSTIDIYGDRAIVGSSSDIDGSRGAVYVYEKMSTGWQLVKKLSFDPSAVYPLSHLGQAVSIWGDWAMASMVCDNGSAVFCLHRESNGQWVIPANGRINPPVSSGYQNYFAYALDMSGNYVVITQYGRLSKAYVYLLTGNAWQRVQDLQSIPNPNPQISGTLGSTVSLWGDYLAVASSGVNFQPAMNFYVKNGSGQFVPMLSRHPSAPQTVPAPNPWYDAYGSCVSVGHGWIVVGAPGDFSNKGSFFTYKQYCDGPP